MKRKHTAAKPWRLPKPRSKKRRRPLKSSPWCRPKSPKLQRLLLRTRPQSFGRMFGRVALLAAALVAAGCQVIRSSEPAPPPAPEPPPIREPLATHKFRFDPEHDDVVGELQVTHVQGEDTLPDIARRFNVGYEELLRANPGVDPWLPGVGRAIVVPTRRGKRGIDLPWVLRRPQRFEVGMDVGEIFLPEAKLLRAVLLDQQKLHQRPVPLGSESVAVQVAI